MHLKTSFTILGLLLSSILISQTIPDSCKLRIGTNLAGPADWGAEFPFKDIMRYGRTWMTHNNQWVGGGENAWDTEVLNQIPLDAQGYPLSLPVEIAGEEAPQIVRTVWDTGGGLPGGTYVVLYDGTGDLDAWGGDVAVTSEVPGRLEIQVGDDNEILALEIYESQMGDHVRNVRVLLPGTETTYEDNPWEENWLEKLQPFQALRFMDWGYTNGSTMRQWGQRTQLDDYTWTQKSGVPYEMWIDICNLKMADAWVCVPHAADDDYVTQMATLFRDNLDPDLKIYVEYSNEVWNWLFAQAQYGLDSLNQNLEWPERLAPRIAHVMQIWTDVFAGQTDRLVRVQGGQHGWFDIGNRIFAQLEADGNAGFIDAISPAAYMGLDHDFIQSNWDASTTGQEVLDHATVFTFHTGEWAMQGWYEHAQLAASKGKKLLFYEGGQHFTPHNFGEEPTYCNALVECQTLPGMYDLYQQLFDTLRTLSNDEMLLMNFSFIGRPSCRYGSWGLLQNQFSEMPPYDDAPKYRAIADGIAVYESCQTATAANEAIGFSIKIFPNPTAELLTIDWGNAPLAGRQVRLFDMAGRLVRAFPEGENTFSMSGFAPGIYLVEATAGEVTEKRLVVRQ